MEHDSSPGFSNEQLIQLADALGKMRDSLGMASLALKDLMAEIPSPARDEVVTEVERYLLRMREATR